MVKTALDLVKEAKAQIREVSVEEAKRLLEADAIALDVRELIEYETGHIPGAHHISRGMLEFMIANHPAFNDKSRSIVVYCKSGGRSALATATLVQLGYTNVCSMMGGFDAWSAGTAIPPETSA